MNRRLALKVFIIDKETSGKWIIKNKALVPWRALGALFLIIHLPLVFIYYRNNIYVLEQWRIQDFPEEGVPTPGGGRQHTILPNFLKMKLKEFGPGGAPP